MRTIRGYDLYECVSAIQKAVRRNQPKIAGYFALECFASNFTNYLWKRLLTISAEDCHGIITQEVLALRESFYLINDKKAQKEKGRIFISKAVLLMSQCTKNRDSDHLQCFIYDNKMIDGSELMEYYDRDQEGIEKIPEYAYDVHTRKGKMRGKTKDMFFREENAALEPKVEKQLSLFDYVLSQG